MNDMNIDLKWSEWIHHHSNTPSCWSTGWRCQNPGTKCALKEHLVAGKSQETDMRKKLGTKRLISATAVEKAAHSPPYPSISVNDKNFMRENKAWFGVFEISAEATHGKVTGQLWDVFEQAPEWSSTIWGYLVAETVCASGYCISSVLTSTYLGCRQGFGIFVSGSSEALSIFSNFYLRHFIKFVCVKESFGEWAGNAGPWQVPQSSRQQKKQFQSSNRSKRKVAD